MGTMKTVTVDVDVDIDLLEFSDDELMQEMSDRGLTPAFDVHRLIQLMYEDYTSNRMDRVEEHMVSLFDEVLGRIA